MSSLPGAFRRCSPSKRDAQLASTPTVASHYFHTPEAGGKVAKDQHDPGRPRPPPASASSTSLPIRPRRSGRSERMPSAPSRTACVKELRRWRGSPTVDEPQTASSQDTYLPDHNAPLHHSRPNSKTRAFVPLRTPWRRSTTSSVAARGPHGRPNDNTVRYESAGCSSPDPRPASTSRPRSGSRVSRRRSPSSTGPDLARYSKPQPGRPRDASTRPAGALWTSGQPPDHFPTGQTATTEADILM